MRDSRPYGLLAAVVLAHKIEQQRSRRRAASTEPKPMTEREQWNAEVARKKAEKKARKEKQP